MGWCQARLESPNGNADNQVLLSFLHPGEPVYFQMIDLLYHSPAAVAIIPVQDALGLGGDARMNVPGEAEGNWDWRVHEGLLTAEVAASLRQKVEASGRFVDAG